MDADNVKQKERETVAIEHDGSYRLINAEDFDASKHKKYEPKAEKPAKAEK